jgi:hypothetical protein
MAEISHKEFGGSSLEDVVVPPVILPPAGNKEIPTESNEGQGKFTQGRKRAIATFLILGSSILVSNFKHSQWRQL